MSFWAYLALPSTSTTGPRNVRFGLDCLHRSLYSPFIVCFQRRPAYPPSRHPSIRSLSQLPCPHVPKWQSLVCNRPP
ncbi:unnamed protein product [Protopolystoma xenopodis]|uniref:Uncharacterized protein n=1 Tax=Protopolystoma xenopodis TaxID=117903 RepID=A0A3S5CPD9_9PLAT|nr:unnamed protein product [Protopolystoma xenopodis]